MNNNVDFCIYCDDFTEYSIIVENKERNYKGRHYIYETKIPRCKECNSVMPVPGYSDLDTELFFKYYRKVNGLISNEEIEKIMQIYNIGKEPLAAVLGFGKVTIKRYFDGQIPSEEYSNILYCALKDISFMEESIEKNKDKMGSQAYNKVKEKIIELKNVQISKIEQVANYIVNTIEGITPLVLQKILYFSQGVSYCKSGKFIFNDLCQAWVHGPVYPTIYSRYKKYGGNEIEPIAPINDFDSLITKEDKEILELVCRTFGLYSGRILELISHEQEPWIKARGTCLSDEKCTNFIDNEDIESYYKKLALNNENKIIEYITDILNSLRS